MAKPRVADAGVSPERFAELAARFSDCRVVVLGDVMLDQYVFGSANRMSPEAPVPVIRAREERFLAGGAGNVAANVSALGLACEVVGVVGDDGDGRTLSAALESAGVKCRLVVDSGRKTTRKTRIVARGQQVARVDREMSGDLSASIGATVQAMLERCIPEAKALILTDYNKGVLHRDMIRRALDLATSHGTPVIADPKRRNFFSFRGAMVLKPNRHELEDALGESVRPGDPVWMESARVRVGCDHLLLTLGPGGMALASPGRHLNRVRPAPRGVFDVTGAGDTVAATVAAMVAAGSGLLESVSVAAEAAAVAVSKVGAAAVTAAEVREALASRASGRGRL